MLQYFDKHVCGLFEPDIAA